MTLPCECGTIIIVSLPSSSLKTFAKKDFKILKKETNSLWTVEANFFSIRLYRCVLDNLSSALFPTTIFASITQRLIACQMNSFLRKGECSGGADGRGRYLETERCCRPLSLPAKNSRKILLGVRCLFIAFFCRLIKLHFPHVLFSGKTRGQNTRREELCFIHNVFCRLKKAANERKSVFFMR